MKLQDKLIELRKEKGWSQEDFAEKLDVSRQAISRWENGTALPDAQNLLRISKLFNVTADYLLNDDYENEADVSAPENVREVTESFNKKKKFPYWYLISLLGLVILSICAIMIVMKSINSSTNDFENDPADEVHIHPVLRLVKENEVAPTCTTEGSYDEVVYCTECGAEVLRIRRSLGMPTHQFVNEKCIVCGEDQREKD